MSDAPERPSRRPPYCLGTVPLTYVNRVRLSALLDETVSKRGRTGDLAAWQRQRVARLVKRWQTRVWRLNEEGWLLTAGNESRYWILRNCRPSLTRQTVESRAAACRRSWICPHCWGREVPSVWKQLEAGYARRQPGAAYVLLTRKLTLQFSNGPELVKALRARAARGRRRDWGRICYQLKTRSGGLYETIRFLPLSGRGWVVQLRQLLLVPAETWDKLGRDPKGLRTDGTRATRNPTKRDLAKAAGWLLRYPSYLLRSSLRVIHELMQIRALLQRAESVGGVRRKVRGIRLRAGLGLFSPLAGRNPACRAAVAAPPLESEPKGAHSMPATDPLLEPPVAREETPLDAFNRLGTLSPHFREDPEAHSAAVRSYVQLVHLGLGDRITPGAYVDALRKGAARHSLDALETVGGSLAELGITEPADQDALLLRACGNVVDGLAPDLPAGLRLAIEQLLSEPQFPTPVDDNTPEIAIVGNLDLTAAEESEQHPEVEPAPAAPWSTPAPRNRSRSNRAPASKVDRAAERELAAAPAPEPTPAPEPQPLPRIIVSKEFLVRADAAIRSRCPVPGVPLGHPAVPGGPKVALGPNRMAVLMVRNDPQGPQAVVGVLDTATRSAVWSPPLRRICDVHTLELDGVPVSFEVVRQATA